MCTRDVLYKKIIMFVTIQLILSAFYFYYILLYVLASSNCTLYILYSLSVHTYVDAVYISMVYSIIHASIPFLSSPSAQLISFC